MLSSSMPLQKVGAALQRLRPFGDVANRHVGHAQNAGLFLHRPAVGQSTEGTLFQVHEVEEAEWRQKAGSPRVDLQTRTSRSSTACADAGSRSPGNRTLRGADASAFTRDPQATLDVHVFGPVQRHQENTSRVPGPVLRGHALAAICCLISAPSPLESDCRSRRPGCRGKPSASRFSRLRLV